MKHPAKITFTLTRLEFDALMHALGNSLDYPDVMDALFADGYRRQAAYRAANKMVRASAEARETDALARALNRE